MARSREYGRQSGHGIGLVALALRVIKLVISRRTFCMKEPPMDTDGH